VSVPNSGNKIKILTLLGCLNLPGCIMIDLVDFMRAVGEDTASVCVQRGDLMMCRTNQPGTVIAAGDVNIAHGVMMDPEDSCGPGETQASGR